MAWHKERIPNCASKQNYKPDEHIILAWFPKQTQQCIIALFEAKFPSCSTANEAPKDTQVCHKGLYHYISRRQLTAIFTFGARNLHITTATMFLNIAWLVKADGAANMLPNTFIAMSQACYKQARPNPERVCCN